MPLHSPRERRQELPHRSSAASAKTVARLSSDAAVFEAVLAPLRAEGKEVREGYHLRFIQIIRWVSGNLE
jgi:hypothetical protein